MPSAWPHCGTDLSITLRSDGGTDKITLTRAQQQIEPEAPVTSVLVPNTPPPPYPSVPSPFSLPPTLESDLHHLPTSTPHNFPPTTTANLASLPHFKRLLCPCACSSPDALITRWHDRAPTLRPYLCLGTVGQLAPGGPHGALHRAAAKMLATILRCGAGSADALLTTTGRSGVAWEGWGEGNLKEGDPIVFEAVGAVIYDMEWTGREEAVELAYLLADAAHTIGPGLRELEREFVREVFQLMLLVDYGLPAYPLCDPEFAWQGPRRKVPRIVHVGCGQNHVWDSAVEL